MSAEDNEVQAEAIESVKAFGMTLDENSSTAEFYGVIAALCREQKKLSERGDDLRQNLEAKETDLKKALQGLAEMKAQGRRSEANGPEAEMKKYLHEEDGQHKGAIRLTKQVNKGQKSIDYGLADDPNPSNEWQKQFQRLLEDKQMVGTKCGLYNTPVCDARIAKHLESAPDFLKKAPGFERMQKLFNDSAGVGAEWIIDMGVPTLIQDERMVGELEAAIPVRQMAAKTEVIPVLTTHPRPFKYVPGTTTDPSKLPDGDVGTSQRILEAGGLTMRSQFELDAEEDHILANIEDLREVLVMALRMGTEDAILNGHDTTQALHQDDLDTWDPHGIWGAGTFAQDHRIAWDGLRRLAFAASNAQDYGTLQTYAGLLTARSTLKSPLGVKENILHVVSDAVMLTKIMAFDEAKTVDKIGAAASNVAGLINMLAMSRIIVSDFMTADLNASGVYDNVTTDLSGVVTFNTSRYRIAQRAGETVFVDFDVTRLVRDWVVRHRKKLFNRDAAATKNVHFGYNWLS